MDPIAREFDRIARLTPEAPPLDAASRRIASTLPAGARVLDVGCGLGGLSAALTAKGCEVVALDLSETMVERARARGVDARRADFMRWTPPHAFDAVVSVNVLHHLPFEPALDRMAAALAPGGALQVVDLCDSDGLLDAPRVVLGWARGALEAVRSPRSRPLRHAWRAHAEHDVLLPFAEVALRARGALPGCSVRRLEAWRYALAWHAA